MTLQQPPMDIIIRAWQDDSSINCNDSTRVKRGEFFEYSNTLLEANSNIYPQTTGSGQHWVTA